MFAALRIALLLPALAGWLAADVPRKAPLTKYTTLWTSSPFTSKPPPPEQGPEVNPLEDYALCGVSPIASGYRVTLIHKKNPEDRIVVDSDKPAGGFEILAVMHKTGDPLATVVRMSSGGVTGTVAFDQALLTLTPPPAANTEQQQPPGAQPQQPVPAVQQPPQQPIRQLRPRVLPPPVNPQAVPAPPGIPVQPGIPGLRSQQRPNRRR
jgi:hypothetical protein